MMRGWRGRWIVAGLWSEPEASKCRLEETWQLDSRRIHATGVQWDAVDWQAVDDTVMAAVKEAEFPSGSALQSDQREQFRFESTNSDGVAFRFLVTGGELDAYVTAGARRGECGE